ncbi:hypothetical protein DFH07DRAFT_502101 [Mycena maculata]|uniref:Glycosyltransferase family 18 catalytic domain-containing protein n=1 Tax=Mycena maculata TaxID=230809 RepID=A0AAD7J0B2_9AGAR|nr:hypothetical protein DFH07DRAFT_502101 [Mycena maculata]
MSPRTPAIVQSSDLSHLSLNRVLFPAGPALDDRSWIAENQRTISALFRCIEANSCTQNQTKVVLLVASPFRELLEGANGGEAIWANSTLIALRRLGYNYLYSNSMARASQLYHIFGALIPVVFVDVPDAYSCFQDENCILSRLRPHGIPAWKILSFHFWDSPDNPLGRRWTLSPEDYRGSEGNTYLGYSVEPQCSRQPFVPHSHRKEQAYVLAKEARYFAPDVDRAHDPDSFEAAAAAIDIRFLAGVRERVLPEYFPRNITNVGFMSAPQFYATLAESRVLVGVGVPFTSPTPWEALCLGVPFINPIHHWSADAPLDKTHWVSQHAALKHLDPPYVYNVFKGDKAGFVRAVVDAIAHPIQSFVAEDMRMRAVEVRLAAVFETDWRSEAARLLAEQQASGSGEAFWL